MLGSLLYLSKQKLSQTICCSSIDEQVTDYDGAAIGFESHWFPKAAALKRKRKKRMILSDFLLRSCKVHPKGERWQLRTGWFQ